MSDSPSGTSGLALGTVQFGLAYGVAGRSEPIPDREAALILKRAWELGIRVLDTATAYGDIESRLFDLMGDHEFRVITKLPSLHESETDSEAIASAMASIQRSAERLGDRMAAVMFHSAVDLTSSIGQAVWREIRDFTQERHISLGVSCYDPATLRQLQEIYDIEISQLPGNALDHRLVTSPPSRSVELHLRSVFLQGLLLMPLQEAVLRVPAAKDALTHWHAWCDAHRVSALTGALSAVKSWRGVSQLVVGVDNLAHLESIVQSWHDTRALDASELAVHDLQVIDPRLWPKHKSTAT